MSKKNTEVPTVPKSGNAGGSQTCDNQVRMLLERQNAKMLKIITLLKQNAVLLNSDGNLVLPNFNPDKADADARSWSTTADLCLADQMLSGSQLMRLVSRAMKGSASTWLTQISYADMTWKEFKDLFINRFGQLQTDAEALINLENERPNADETLAAYANRLVARFVNRWKDSHIEKIAVSTVLAHISLFDSDVRRMACATVVSSRQDLQRELQAFSLKRKCPRSFERNTSNVNKRAKLGQLFKCIDAIVSSQDTASAPEKSKFTCSECGVSAVAALGRTVIPMTWTSTGNSGSAGIGSGAAKSDTGAQGKPGSDTGAQGKPGSDSGAQGKPGSDSSAQGKPGSDTGTEGKPDSDSGAQGKPGSDTGAQGKPGGDTGAQGKPGGDTGAQGKPGGDTGAQGKPGGDTGAQGKPGGDTGAQGKPGGDTGAQGKPGGDTGAQGKPGGDTGAQGKPGGDTGAQGKPGGDTGAQGKPGGDTGAQGKPGGDTGAQGKPGSDTGAQGKPGSDTGGAQGDRRVDAYCQQPPAGKLKHLSSSVGGSGAGGNGGVVSSGSGHAERRRQPPATGGKTQQN